MNIPDLLKSCLECHIFPTSGLDLFIARIFVLGHLDEFHLPADQARILDNGTLREKAGLNGRFAPSLVDSIRTAPVAGLCLLRQARSLGNTWSDQRCQTCPTHEGIEKIFS